MLKQYNSLRFHEDKVMRCRLQTEEKQGIIIVAVAYVLWGFMPIYWKLLDHVVK